MRALELQLIGVKLSNLRPGCPPPLVHLPLLPASLSLTLSESYLHCFSIVWRWLPLPPWLYSYSGSRGTSGEVSGFGDLYLLAVSYADRL